MKKLLFTIVMFLVALTGLAFVVRGMPGNPLMYQSGYDTSVGSPFESTNSTSRYVLVEAIADYNTFALNDSQAKAASPDLVKYEDTYMTIFTPGVSILAVPFYKIGKLYGIPQFTTYLLNVIVAAFNVLLIAKLSQKLGASYFTSWVSGFVFLFATNALAYALTFTQHHLSVSLVIASLLLVLQKKGLFRNLLMGAVFAAGILVDIPNAFLLLPPLLIIGFSHIQISDIQQKFKVSINFLGVALIIGMIPLLAVLANYNKDLTGSYTTLGQFLGRYDYPDPNKPLKPEEITAKLEREKTPRKSSGIRLPFRTREQLQGMHILLISKQRSWIYYSPIVWVGLLGVLVAMRFPKTKEVGVGIVAVLLMNLILYASFGDPWGGWSFGPRYLIPAAALLCAGIGVVLTRAFQNKVSGVVVTIVFFALLLLSVHTNVLGAVTTSAIPPKGEAESLQNDTPWTTVYNDRMIARNELSSYIFNWELREDMTGKAYLNLLVASYMGVITVLYIAALGREVWKQRRAA